MKLESHHSVLTTSKKQNKLKINNSSQIHQIIDVTGQTSPLPLQYRKKTGGYRESQLTGPEIHGQKSLRTSNGVEKPK